MKAATNRFLAIALCAVGAAAFYFLPSCHAMAAGQQSQPATATNRRIGTVREISGTVITLAPDSRANVTVTVEPTTRIVRIAPGEKDLKNAEPIQLQDVQIGDRILVGGKDSDDNHSFVASSIVVMKRSDLEA